MKNPQLHHIIHEARLVGADRLENFVARAGALEAEEVQATVERALQIIEGIPQLLDAVAEAAETRGIGLMVRPLLDHASAYFLNPLDHAPELAFGVTGLLDDAYLSLRLVHLIQLTFQPLVSVDVEAQLDFLRDLLGNDLVAQLDAETGRAVLKLAMDVAALQESTGSAPAVVEPPLPGGR